MLVISQSGILVFFKYVFCILQILGIGIIKLRVLIDASVMWRWFLTPRYVAIYRVCVCVWLAIHLVLVIVCWTSNERDIFKNLGSIRQSFQTKFNRVLAKQFFFFTYKIDFI